MMVNRDLTHRIRHISGFSVADAAAYKELAEALRLIRYFDSGTGLWKDEGGNDTENPLLAQAESVLETTTTVSNRNVKAEDDGDGKEGDKKAEEVKKEDKPTAGNLHRNDDLLKVRAFSVRIILS